MSSQATGGKESSRCPVVSLEYEQLPDMHLARTGHHTFFLEGEPVVIGGHTSGFVPTATAEYFHDGEWHLMQTSYPHDQSMAVELSSGTIVLAGGHEQSLGIGQTFPVELYFPKEQRFDGYGCLELKRCFAEGVEIDSGRVIITGNWYHDDGIECYDGSRQCLYVKDVSQQRSLPYVLRTAKDNAVIFSSYDHHGHALDTIVVDRLKGDSFAVPLFEQWRPFYSQVQPHLANSFIGDVAAGRYSYLFTVVAKDGQLGLVKTDGERFELLDTDFPVPMDSEWGAIHYFSYVVADRKAEKAYVVGCDDDHRYYVLSISYARKPAELTLYHTTPFERLACSSPVLTDDGNLLIAGGAREVNFTPYSSVVLLYTGNSQSLIHSSTHIWLWLLAVVFLLCLAVLTLFVMLRRRRPQAVSQAAVVDIDKSSTTDDGSEELMERICQLMEQEKLFLDSGLKVSDVAQRLGVRSRQVSDCIKSQRDILFAQFINVYRVEYAKHLLRNFPDIKMAAVWAGAGFSHEATFFRTFKAVVGMTPKEWMAKKD